MTTEDQGLRQGHTGNADGNKGKGRPAVPVLKPLDHPVKVNDVYIDDIIYGVQGDEGHRRQHVW